jgi:hypothetical protein
MKIYPITTSYSKQTTPTKLQNNKNQKTTTSIPITHTTHHSTNLTNNRKEGQMMINLKRDSHRKSIKKSQKTIMIQNSNPNNPNH